MSMEHWIVAPIIIPALIGPLMVLTMRHDASLQRIAGLASAVALVGITVALLVAASNGDVESYELGSWPAPFGIVLVLDRLSALMITLTAVLGQGRSIPAVGGIIRPHLVAALRGAM
jgi:multicomponent K+:H+ antiporter subunit D